jgi:hypothetical protein
MPSTLSVRFAELDLAKEERKTGRGVEERKKRKARDTIVTRAYAPQTVFGHVLLIFLLLTR